MTWQEKLTEMLNTARTPLTAEDMLIGCGVPSEEGRLFFDLLRSMELNGTVVLTKKKKYARPGLLGYKTGVLRMANAGTYGFFCPEDGSGDWFVAKENLNGALHEDVVLARELDAGQHTSEGTIERVLQRARREMPAVLRQMGRDFVAMPADKRLPQCRVSRLNAGDARVGDAVLIRFLKTKSPKGDLEGKVIEKLGAYRDPFVDREFVIREYGLKRDFDKKTRAEAETLPETVAPDAIYGRLDLRNDLIVTMDGADARDLDDAISIEKQADGTYAVGVHIADVSHYVPLFSALDTEAAERGTSVYFPDFVLPMLPPELSNGIASLHPGVDRLTMSCLMEVDHRGMVKKYRIEPSVIRSKRRFTYEEVNRALQDPAALKNESEALWTLVEHARDLMEILYQKRMNRGGVDFDFPELIVSLDADGVPSLSQRIRGTAERIIEELMLLANETVAEHLSWLSVPQVNRVHEEPDADKMEDLKLSLAPFGLKLRTTRDGVPSSELARVLSEARETPEADYVSMLILRSMKKARYTPEPLGHYALAARYYTHFTSPIRRYPDLLVHRMLKLASDPDPRAEAYYEQHMAELLYRASVAERTAESAEFAYRDRKVAEYMQSHIGEEFVGTVSGMNSYAMFVLLQNGAEGMIRLRDMDDDYYDFDPKRKELFGTRRRRHVRPGNRVSIRVEKADKFLGEVTFSLLNWL